MQLQRYRDLRYAYDERIDVLYVSLEDGPIVAMRPLDEARYVNIGPHGQPVGVRLLSPAQSGVDVTDLPRWAEIVALLLHLGCRFHGAFRSGD